MNYERFDLPLLDMEMQSPKDCKKQTPNFVDANPKKGKTQIGFKVKDTLILDNVVSLYNKRTLDGIFEFDSYDKYDNTCYVTKERSNFTYNVLLTDIRLWAGK